MKRKKPLFYGARIKALSLFLAFFIIGVSAITYASPGKTEFKAPTAMEASATLNNVAFAFTPLAVVQKLKNNKSFEKLDEGQQKFLEDLEKEINETMKSVKEGMTSAEVDAKFKDIKGLLTPEQLTEFEEGMKAIKEHAKFIEKQGEAGVGKDDGIGYVVKAMKEREADIKTFKTNKTGKLEIEIKSQIQQYPTDIATHTIGERVPGIGQLPVRKPFIKDLFRVVPCGLEYIKYIDQESVVRDAKNVATAAVSTHLTKLTWKERSIQIANVRDLIDIPINMLEDYDFVEGEMKKLIEDSVQLKIDRDLLSDDGVWPNLHSIDEKASEFDASNTLGGTIEAWTNKIQTPNIFDLIVAMSSQIVALGQDGSYMPNVVLFNTIDRFKSLLIKDKNDQYILPPFVARVNGTEYNIEGMIVRSNPLIPANSLRVFDSTKGTIYSRKTAIMEMSYENNNNFETEVVTLKGYERLNFLIRNVDANAFMKCSDIDTALLALKKP